MKNTIVGLVLIWAFTFMLASCNHHDYSDAFNKVYSIVDSMPDSSLCLLRKMNMEAMSTKDKAKYALLFTIAQDKSGLDVDDDSLIRIAYDWYSLHKEDSLYAKCMNYMGTYYMLNDSVEKAESCLKESYVVADSLNDFKTVGLVLDKLAKIESSYNTSTAVKYAQKELAVYKKLCQIPSENLVYGHLRLSECLMLDNKKQQSLKYAWEAKTIAVLLGDSLVLADCYQNLSNVFEKNDMKDSSLVYAKAAATMHGDNCVSTQLALASAYINVDSLVQGNIVLDKISLASPKIKYCVYYLKNRLALKSKKYQLLTCYSDSAFDNLEKMYQAELLAKTHYYISMLQKEKDNTLLKYETTQSRWILILVVALFVCLLFFVFFIFYGYQKQAKQKLQKEREEVKLKEQHEREMHLMEKKMLEDIHKKELLHKETQLGIMRKYLYTKIDVLEKLNSVAENSKHLTFNDEDWTEIEIYLDSADDLFVKRLAKLHPNLSKSDKRLMMLLRLHCSQKSLAMLYGISEKAIKQKLYLYKEKVGISTEKMSLREYIEGILWRVRCKFRPRFRGGGNAKR